MDTEQEDYVEEPSDVEKLLPAWFAARMYEDEWSFGLLLITGHVMPIRTIDRVTVDAAGELWLDVYMDQEPCLMRGTLKQEITVLAPPCDRCKASVKASHVVAAFEMYGH